MTTMTEYLAARERVEDATDCSGAAREDHEMVAVSVGDLLRILAGPPVSREDAKSALQASRGWPIDLHPGPAADAIAALYRGETK